MIKIPVTAVAWPSRTYDSKRHVPSMGAPFDCFGMDDCIRATLYHAQRSHVSESIPTPDSDGPPFGDRKPLSGAGIGASYSAQRKGVAQQVFPSGVSSGTEDRQGRHGTEAGGSHVL